jgi:iron-sulfur cluster repair protein YtfE (RIC family)
MVTDTNAARHGAGDADLTIMLAAHDGFRRDLVKLAHAASSASRLGPAHQDRVRAGWETFKHQLHLHHTAEDELVWPALRTRLAVSASAQSVLASMEEEHARVDPLLAAVDHAFAHPEDGRTADATTALASDLLKHLAHEERDALPLIGVWLTAAEWRGVGFKIARKNGLSAGGEMFAWMADGAEPAAAAVVIGTLPPPARLVYRALWRPRYARTRRW